jgi:signal transduction histidine kinase
LTGEGGSPGAEALIADNGETVVATGSFRVSDASGGRTGIMLVQHDLSATANQLKRIRSGVAFAAITTAIVLTLLIVAFLNQLVFGQLRRMETKMAAALAALGGEPLADPDARVDEITRFERQLKVYSERLEEVIAERTQSLRATNRELESANEAKSRLLANMSHELRTPLNSIIGFTGIMLVGCTGPLTEEQRRQLGFVSRSGKHLLALVEDLLDLSRIEAGGVTLTPRQFSVDVLMDDLITDAAHEAQRQSIDLSLSVAPEGMRMTTDDSRLAQVLRNLVDNAIKYTPAGGWVSVAARPTDDGRVRFSVADSGVGIRSEHQEWIFRAFTQTDEAAAHRVGGAGLGLSICRMLVHGLGGTIFVSSAEGQGSMFSVTVPADLPADHGPGGLIELSGPGCAGPEA